MKKSLIVFGIISLILSSSFAQTEQKESKYAIETDIRGLLVVLQQRH